jgi:hypothetical protein
MLCDLYTEHNVWPFVQGSPGCIHISCHKMFPCTSVVASLTLCAVFSDVLKLLCKLNVNEDVYIGITHFGLRLCLQHARKK